MVLVKRIRGNDGTVWEGRGGPRTWDLNHPRRGPAGPGGRAGGAGRGAGPSRPGTAGFTQSVAPAHGDITGSTSPLLNLHWQTPLPRAQARWKASPTPDPDLPTVQMPLEHLRHRTLKNWNLCSHLSAPTRIHWGRNHFRSCDGLGGRNFSWGVQWAAPSCTEAAGQLLPLQFFSAEQRICLKGLTSL